MFMQDYVTAKERLSNPMLKRRLKELLDMSMGVGMIFIFFVLLTQ